MKKITKILALVLALTLVLSLAACSKGPSIAGSWKYTVDFQKAMEASGEAEGLEELGEEMAGLFDGLTMVMVLDLTEDGKYTFAFDEASVKAAAEGLVSKMKELLPGMLASMYDMSEDELKELLESQGTSIDAMLKDMEDEFDTNELVDQIKEATSTGTYTYEGGKLTLKGDNGEGDVLVVTLEENKLTVTEVEGEGFDDYKVLLPMEFVR